jgi:DNA adenine methylase
VTNVCGQHSRFFLLLVMEQLTIFTQANEPLKTYPGRKGAAGQLQQILAQIPKCGLFIDAMCGSGIVGLTVKEYGCQVVINDLNGDLIDKIAYTAANVSWSNEHYRAVIRKYDNGNQGRVIYFDPPYLFDTRSYKKPIYKHEWSEADHRAFLRQVKKMTIPVIISHYPCKMYDKALQGWRKVTYNTMTRAGVRDESLYMNFEQPTLLQCYQVVGKNFTDRQRIKRKVGRMVAKLQNENGQERAAILSAVIEAFDYVKGK